MSAGLDQQLERIDAEIGQLTRKLADGEACSIEQLDPLLTRLMAELRSGPREQGLAYTPHLLALQDSLDQLKAGFCQQQDQAKAAMETITTRLKAATAYARSAASTDTNPAETEPD